MSDALQLGEFFVAENWCLQLNQVAAFWLWIQQITFSTDGGDRRSDDLFADTVDRRIGNLSEELMEVVIDQLRFVREYSNRCVCAHGANGLHAITCHRSHQQTQIFKGVAKGKLTLKHGLVVRLRERSSFTHIRQFHQVLIKPLAIRFF